LRTQILANFFTQKKITKNQGTTLRRQISVHFRQQSKIPLTSDGAIAYSVKKILKDAADQFNYNQSPRWTIRAGCQLLCRFSEYSLADYGNALTDLKRAEQSEAYASIVPYLIANVYYKQKDYDALIAYAKTISTKTDLANADEDRVAIG